MWYFSFWIKRYFSWLKFCTCFQFMYGSSQGNEASDISNCIQTKGGYTYTYFSPCHKQVMCLAVASKQAEHKKLVTDAHSAVRELCTSTHLFFLFIQISKMISKKSGHSGKISGILLHWSRVSQSIYRKFIVVDIDFVIYMHACTDVYTDMKTFTQVSSQIFTYIRMNYTHTDSTHPPLPHTHTLQKPLHYASYLAHKQHTH